MYQHLEFWLTMANNITETSLWLVLNEFYSQL